MSADRVEKQLRAMAGWAMDKLNAAQAAGPSTPVASDNSLDITEFDPKSPGAFACLSQLEEGGSQPLRGPLTGSGGVGPSTGSGGVAQGPPGIRGEAQPRGAEHQSEPAGSADRVEEQLRAMAGWAMDRLKTVQPAGPSTPAATPTNALDITGSDSRSPGTFAWLAQLDASSQPHRDPSTGLAGIDPSTSSGDVPRGTPASEGQHGPEATRSSLDLP